MRLDLKENIVFPFSDPSWIAKTLIGSACQLLGVTMPALVGYQLAIIRQTANGEDEKLPEFENFFSLWVRGLLVTIILGMLIAVPTTVIVTAVVGGAVAMGDQMTGAAVMGMIGAVGVLMVFCLALGFLMPAMTLRYAMTEQLSSFFDVATAIGDIKQGLGDYIMIFLFPIVAGIAVNSLAVATAGLGIVIAIPATVLIMYIQARMIGSYYRLYFM